MNQNINTSKSDTVKTSTVVLIIFATIITTVAALDMNGAIKHSENKTDVPVAGYKVIFIENMDDKSYRLSHKSSDQTAVCNDSYLFVTSDNDPAMQGLLVDYKNRGIRCH
jgi:hypothetical protein